MKFKKSYFCPVCGTQSFEPYQIKAFKCNQCDFLYYHNVAATSSAIISVGDEILLVTRARDPEKGKLDLPGGFVEKYETAEQAMQREVKEELALELTTTATYICSATNRYLYADVMYNTLDMFFHVALDAKPEIHVADDVADYNWFKLEAIPHEQIGFNCMAIAIKHYHEMLQQ